MLYKKVDLNFIDEGCNTTVAPAAELTNGGRPSTSRNCSEQWRRSFWLFLISTLELLAQFASYGSATIEM